MNEYGIDIECTRPHAPVKPIQNNKYEKVNHSLIIISIQIIRNVKAVNMNMNKKFKFYELVLYERTAPMAIIIVSYL